MVKCYIWNHFSSFDTVLSFKAYPFLCINWRHIFYYSWDTCYYVQILLCSIPSGFIVFRIIIGGLIAMLGVLCLYSMWNDEYRKAIVICSRLMECATEVLTHDYKLLLYIPIFIFFFVGLVFLVAFQFLAVWSAGSLTFNPELPFYDVVGFVSNFFSFFVSI